MRLTGRPSAARVVAGAPADAVAEVVDRRLAAAFVRGEESGRAAALAAGAVALDEAAARLDSAADEARARAGEDAVRLALAVAHRLLRLEIDAGRYDLERIVRETLAESSIGRRSCTVHLHPDDFARLEGQGVEFRAGTTLAPDTSVPRGDVHVETAEGLLVHEVERAVQSIGERILGDLP